MIPLTLVLGHPGTGKTRLVAERVKGRPNGERWVVLLAERGRTVMAGVAPWLVVREIDAGCLCCVGAVALRVALTRIVREVRPDRLILEAPGLAHARRIVRAFDDYWLAQSVKLDDVLLVLGAEPVADEIVALATAVVRPSAISGA